MESRSSVGVRGRAKELLRSYSTCRRQRWPRHRYCQIQLVLNCMDREAKLEPWIGLRICWRHAQMMGRFECGDLIRRLASSATWRPMLNGLGRGALIVCSGLVQCKPANQLKKARRRSPIFQIGKMTCKKYVLHCPFPRQV